MDAETLRMVIEAIVASLAFVLWAVFWNTKKLAENVVTDLAAYKLHVAETYVTNNSLNKTIEALSRALDNLQAAVFKKLDRIEEKLDGKVDKPHGS